MLALSFAAVPLYRLYCQATGFGGTPQTAAEAPSTVLDRSIAVRFDGNVSNGLPWQFHPVESRMRVKLGETAMARFEAVNLSSQPVTGTAVFNVSPARAAVYFNKVQCFCFTRQRLEPGQRADMPVTFFIDPQLAKDARAAGVSEVTLSYTFYPAQEEEPSVARVSEGRRGS
jgi:cytochrome c oxidase assembly protein subunit 11